MSRLNLRQLYLREFREYSKEKFFKDLFAGLTVAAVALPLALAFGVASGSTAASGLVTAILGGLIIGMLSGAPYQISGPTGAMSAVLIVLAQRYGIQGVWIAGFFSGVLLLIIGFLRLGRFIAFIPAPVVSGFTSGIAFIIAVGQIDSLLGISTPFQDSAAHKLLAYYGAPFQVNAQSFLIGALVMMIMVVWPAGWRTRFPAALFGIVIATILSSIFGLQTATIGEIPTSIVLDDRLSFSSLEISQFTELIVPILSITALGAIESLLCGAVASNMSGIRLQTNQELIAQGIGNMAIPFFGGVPATAAIARTSVGIKAGGVTRVTGIIHALALLASVFLFAPIISQIPMSALAGVLIVTAFRMNEWDEIRFYFSRHLTSAIAKFGVTFIATITLDLTYAILLGVAIAAAKFLSDAAQITIDLEKVDLERLKKNGIELSGEMNNTKVAYLTGPLFFGATGHFVEAFSDLRGIRALILSMRGVPILDSSGLRVLHELWERLSHQGGKLYFAGVQDAVKQSLVKSGLAEEFGEKNFFWTSAEAIVAAHHDFKVSK